MTENMTPTVRDLIDRGAQIYEDKTFIKFVRDGKVDRGIVICTTGIGISIAANKVRGIRCALCGDLKSAEMTRKHNDTNMLAMGAGIIPLSLALEITDTWLNTAFEGGERHVRRIGKITAYEAGKEQL